ncbi:hypothetical protein SD81_015600 [Tolypothrix campylonemoides VB511288]|nr:hypothetical protein SD81_015600 [Tolypothrix campylonemoides VB511288]
MGRTKRPERLRGLRAASIVALAVVVVSTWLLAAGVVALYGWGSWRTPPLPAPRSDGIDARSRAMYWRMHAGDGPMRMPRATPLRVATTLLRSRDVLLGRSPRPEQILGIATRATFEPLQQNPPAGDWILWSWTRRLQLSQAWTGEQAVDHVLSSIRLRDGGRGLRDASARWYAMAPERLGDAERLVLLVAMDVHANPACDPRHFVLRVRRSATRVGIDPEHALADARRRMVATCAPAPAA